MKRTSKIATLSAVIILTVILIKNLGGRAEPVEKTPLPEIDLTKFNHFEQKEGLFSFDYKNNYEVIKNKEVYFLRELQTGNTAFQIFENNNQLTFNDNNYTCEKKESEICYSTQSPPEIITNIQIYPERKSPDRTYRLLTRAEALKIIFDLRYPDVNFEKERANCFKDISRLHPLSGYICYAKKIGTVVGIDESFYPDSSVNLWGYLKILFTSFDVQDFKTKHDIQNEKIFELMTKYHLAYPLIRKSYYEGLFNNVHNSDIWPNRHVYLDEAVLIATNFFQWQKGKTIRDYETSQGFNLPTYIQKKNPFREFTFIEIPPESFDFDKTTETKLFDKDIYFKQPGNVWEYLYTFEKVDNISNIALKYDADGYKGDMLITYTNGQERNFELQINNDQFAYLTTNVQNAIQDPNVLPNPARMPDSSLPHLQLTLSNEDFNSILTDRTITTKYPAYLTLTYPDGTHQDGSVLVKTRGNASRGYIKSSYTLEAFEDFVENPTFNGDEFLEGSDEIKLRSMISDDSMIKEKLIYNAFKDLGNIAPDFFDVTIEINGLQFGFFQLTEEINKDFFQRHGAKVENYYYAQNITSAYLANLTPLDDEDIYETHYKTKGSEKKLITFITDLQNNEKAIYEDINIQNVFDYAFLTYITAANDSLTHNYYLYFDEDDQTWGIALWDADAGFQFTPYINKSALKKYGLTYTGTYNNLIRYVFRNTSAGEFNKLYANFIKRWKENVDLVGQINKYLREDKELFIFDNNLWNGLHLERKVPYFDTIMAIIELKERAQEIQERVH